MMISLAISPYLLSKWKKRQETHANFKKILVKICFLGEKILYLQLKFKA